MLNIVLPLAVPLLLGSFIAPQSPRLAPAPKAQDNKRPIAEVGEKAPQFELKDQNGKMHTLESYEGSIVVLEWFNDKCPVCKNVWDSGLISKLVTESKNLCQNLDKPAYPPVVYLAINSSANRPLEEVLKSGAEFIEEAEVKIPMLMDYEGKIGKAYGARTTPHMFVIDADGVLVYQGALSDDRRGKDGKDADTHVMRAIHQLVKGEKVSPSYVQPWGCSVKYSRANDESSDRRRQPRGPRRGPGR